MTYRIIFLLLLFFPFSVSSRPVSYPDGWTFMTRNNWEKNRVHMHYSPSVKYSLGLAFEHFRYDNENVLSLQLNKLLLRKNTETSQRNLYFKSQAGASGFSGGGSSSVQPNILLGLAGDWETRRNLISYEASGRFEGFKDKTSFHHAARFGLAPYLGDYGDLHTWLMIQFEHHPQEDDRSREFIATPIIRFFKSEYLLEAGYSFEKDLLVNFVYRH